MRRVRLPLRLQSLARDGCMCRRCGGRAFWRGSWRVRPAPAELVIDPRLAECHFGAWEGLRWDAIYADSGDAMMGLVTAPHAFRPGGDGETTFAMRDRVMAWVGDVVTREAGPIVAICHGGPIAAIRGTLSDAPVSDWPSLVPRYGEVVTVEVRADEIGAGG